MTSRLISITLEPVTTGTDSFLSLQKPIDMRNGHLYLPLVKRLQTELTLLYGHCYKRNKYLVAEF